MKTKYPKTLLLVSGFLVLLALGYLVPHSMVIPVQGASVHDWHRDTFWYAPWGRSGVHKGIDIFATAGAPVVAAADGLVIYTGSLGIGGKVVAVLGGHWRLHYYAHLQSIDVSPGTWIRASRPIGRVGSTGNAAGKPPHLHYTILSLLPRPDRFDAAAPQGWKKMFVLDPGALLRQGG